MQDTLKVPASVAFGTLEMAVSTKEREIFWRNLGDFLRGSPVVGRPGGQSTFDTFGSPAQLFFAVSGAGCDCGGLRFAVSTAVNF